MRTRVTFNGVDLTRLFAVSNLNAPLLPREIASQERTGGDGYVFTGARIGERSISMTLTVHGKSPEDIRAAERELAAILAVEEPAPLTLSIDNGIYWMAVAKADGNGKRFTHAARHDVTFVCHDPVAYGAHKVVTVPSGGSVSFRVGGTYPTIPIVRAPSAVRNNDGIWKLTLDGGDYLIASLATGSATSIVADCQARVLKVAGVVKALQPAADWLVLTPGLHTLTMVGSGAATVEYQERWV